jgi:hypothetical protein
MKVENSLRFNNTYEDYHQRQNEIERELHKLEQDRQIRRQETVLFLVSIKRVRLRHWNQGVKIEKKTKQRGPLSSPIYKLQEEET